MFASWGAVAHRHRIPVLLAVLVAVIAGGVWGLGVFDRMSQGGYEAPGSEAAQAKEVAGDAVQGGDLVILYNSPDGKTVDDPAVADKVNQTLDALPGDATGNITSHSKMPVPQLANADRTAALATIDLNGDDVAAKMAAYKQIENQLDVPGVQSQVAGEIPMQASMEDRSMSDLAVAEAISIPIVLILLVVIFGGVVAASLPVLVGGLAVFGSLGLLNLISMFAGVNVFAVNVASLLGLGMAIDYGLFIVGRFREELADGRDTAGAVRRSVASAGRTVAFSSTLLIIALAGLMLFPQEFLKSLAYGGMSSVALAAVISLTVLPAVLGMLGHRVDKLAMPWRKNGKNRKHGQSEGNGWSKLADGVMKRPVLTAVPIIAVLVGLGAPFLNVQFGTPDERMLPESDTARQSIEALRGEFPNMSGNGIQVVMQGSPEQPAVQQYVDEVGNIPGIESVQPNGSEGDVVVFNAALSGDPYGDQSNQAVQHIRDLAPPAGGEVLVGGPTALNLDSLQATAEIMPWVGAMLIGATLLLMFLAFGSVLLPIKAVVMSALSLSATFGVLTWIFVDGHGAGLLGVTPTPMEVGIVVLMASVVFGLSTDYEVFLLSRMVEARAHGASTEEAVRIGLSRTGRMITAAALLLIVVTGAFAFSGITMMRFIGVGMIFALALDATLVRMVLVPAVLKLFGNAAWWAPGPLKRVQKQAAVQEEEETEPERERRLETIS